MQQSDPLRSLMNPVDDHLEFTIQDSASAKARTEIIQALATISEFFGVRLEGTGGGSGGLPLHFGDPNRDPAAYYRPVDDSSSGGLQ